MRERLLGVDHRAGEQQLERPAPSHQPRKPHGAAVARPDAELDLGLAEPGGLAGDAKVARHRQLAAAAEREAVDGGDDGLAASLQTAEYPLPVERPRLGRSIGTLAAELANVRAGHERLGAGTGEHRAARSQSSPRDLRRRLDPAPRSRSR